MLIYEYKLHGNQAQYEAIEEAIRVTQFIRNKCLRLWMDTRGISKNDLQCSCAVLAKDFPFATCLNSQARQAAADRAWFAISRFYENCKTHKPGKKGFPRFQRDNRSVEYKQTGWKLDADGRHLTFTDGCNIGRLRLVGNSGQHIEQYPIKQIKRVRLIKRADGYYVQFAVRQSVPWNISPLGHIWALMWDSRSSSPIRGPHGCEPAPLKESRETLEEVASVALTHTEAIRIGRKPDSDWQRRISRFVGSVKILPAKRQTRWSRLTT